jgi:indolepyruvate ferredoxin oxidoreductase alpha subunit
MNHRNATRAQDPLMCEEEGHTALLLGNEAIVRGALEAGVGFACGYPGTPSSEVTDSFARIAEQAGIVFEYSVNEKIALEMAFAASLAGTRSLCAMKHLGLMVAGDPLSTIPYLGVEGGMVIVSAGDPSCLTSPNEQDQRHLGRMLHLPTLDPSTPAEARTMTRLAFELSERSRLPVLLRITTRAAHTRAPVPFGALSPIEVRGFKKDPLHRVPIPMHARKLRLEVHDRLRIARDFLAASGLFHVTGDGPQAVVAAGVPAATCSDLLTEHGLQDQVSLARLGAVHPLPETELLAFLAEREEVLVLEELSPFLEDSLRALSERHGLGIRILGKGSGHLPEEFEYEPRVIQKGLHEAFGLLPAVEPGPAPVEVPVRPPVLCASCPHRSTYFAARSAFPDEQLYFNDIGCYSLGVGAPLETADAMLCMGAGFTLAAGVSRTTGQRTVGFLGDSTFFHSGMPALLNCIKEEVNMVAVILDNQVTAMTGFQESPGMAVDDRQPGRKVSIEGVVRALGAPHVQTVDPMDLPAMIDAFEQTRDRGELSVIIAEHPCPVYYGKVTGEALNEGSYEVDQDMCARCGRDACGMRCDLGVMVGFERHLARGRALETDTGERPTSAAVAPCTERCPLSICIQGYTGHIAAGRYEAALELILSRNPLADSVCRVCHRPCERSCVRSQVDENVGINDLKRFVMDWAAQQEQPAYVPRRDDDHGRSVVVVGAGPAGLTAAHDLRLRGYEVTLVDAADEPGGLLRSGIPEFRLPAEALNRDVERILGMGVRFQGGLRLGADRSLTELRDEYDGVLLALGAQRPGTVELNDEPGAELPEMVDGLAWLQQPAAVDDLRVVVVGGGNAAIDAARTALRQGARSVAMVVREDRARMPAFAEEVDAAVAEGVELHNGLDPQGRCTRGLRCGPWGDSPAAPVTLEADRIVVAIGQGADSAVLAESGLRFLDDGLVWIDRNTGQTALEGVFAAGDLTSGPATVTDAMAMGQRAAWGLDRSLRGVAAADRRSPPPFVTDPPPSGGEPTRDRRDRRARARAPELEPEARRRHFDEVVGGLSEEQAQREAQRCMICGGCANCRSCLDLFGCPAFYIENGLVEIDAALCTGCGVCADFCPNHAIVRVEEVSH